MSTTLVRTPRRGWGLVLALAAIVSVVPAPAAHAAAGRGNFVLRCEYSHTLADDPIVFPGLPGASHLHDYFGNTTTNAASTVGSMLAGAAECRDRADTAGYWAPSGYLNGVQITPLVMRIYYLSRPGQSVETIPPGLQMIGGNHDAGSAADNPHVQWFCGSTTQVQTPLRDSPYDCTSFAGHPFVDGVVGVVDMPNCWNGVGLRPEDVTYEVGGACPPAFPHVLPRLSQRIHYGVMNPLNPDGSVALSLSSGPYYSLHSDFWNTWRQERLDQLVQNCLVAGVHCGDVRNPREIAWIRQFGTSRYDHAFATDADATGVYVAGFTKRALEGQTYLGQADAFVRRYDPDGNELWTRQFGTSGIDQALAIAVDATGVYVGGFTDTAFPGQIGGGGRDAFVRRFSVDGEAIWTKQFGTAGNDQVIGIALDDRGVYVTGSTDGTFFDQIGSGAADTFVRTFDPDGLPLWTEQFGTEATDLPTGIVVDDTGVYVAGTTDGVFPEQTGAGMTDVFLTKHDLYGNRLWTRQFGTSQADEAFGVALTSARVTVAGSTLGAFPTWANQGEWDLFLRRYRSSGKDEWTHQLGTPESERAFTLSAGTVGLYVAGWIHGAFPGEIYQGDRDVFVVKVL